jgi:hypothetical protein
MRMKAWMVLTPHLTVQSVVMAGPKGGTIRATDLSRITVFNLPSNS